MDLLNEKWGGRGEKGGEMKQWKGGNSSWVSHSFLMQQITCIFSKTTFSIPSYDNTCIS